MTGALLGTIALALVAVASLLLARAFVYQPLAELALAAYVIAFAEVVGLSLLLTAFGELSRGALVVGAAFVLVGAIGVALLVRPARPRRPSSSSLHALTRHGPLVVLGVLVVLALGYVVALALVTPPNGWDPLNYHLARAAFWVQEGGVGYLDAAYDQRLNFNPPNAEIAVAFALSIVAREQAAGLVQLLALLACSVGVFAIARRLGLRPAEGVFGGLLFLTMPIVLLQASTAKNDVVAGSFLVAAAVFVSGDSLRTLPLLSLATALAVGTKFTAAYGLAVLLVLALVAPPRGARLPRVMALGAGSAFGAYWYAVNLSESGHLLGDQTNVPGLTAVLHPAENTVTAVGLLVDWFDLSGAVGSDLYVYVLVAVAAFAALVLAARQRGAPPRGLLVVVALVASPLVLHALSTEVGRPALVGLHEALGSPRAFLAEGDEVNSSPAIASDTASWFGPAGLLLAAGVGVVAVVLVRRRLLPPLALVTAVAPAAWLVLVALTLTYHPWQGRFFVFPVALSAALWGVTLRAPAVAWGMTALAGTTAFLSLVHFQEKPSGLRLLERSPTASVWAMERSRIQSLHDPALEPVLAFIDDRVPRRDAIGLALGANEFGFPVFGPRLERRVVLVPFGSSGADIHADWLFANPERAAEIDRACWREELRGDAGTVFRRTRPDCVD